jgi:hypothetical protein
MKKVLFIIGSLFILLLLVSCKPSKGECVGLWLVCETIDTGNSEYSIEELENKRIEFDVKYYVDGYTSNKVIDYLDGTIPYQKGIDVYQGQQLSEFLKIILIYLKDGKYHFEREATGYPMFGKERLPYTFKVKDYSVTITYYYKEVTN